MSLQAHVHIALTLSGTPEFAPMFSWKISFPDYIERPEIILSQKRTSKGKLRWHTINDSAGAIKFMNYQMTIKCVDDDTYTARQYLDFLKAMNGEQVQFVDFDHPADGTDHTSYIKLMRLQITRVKPMTPMLNYYMVDVNLEDDNTVS